MKESLIIDYLIGSQDYSRRVLPFLKEEYFKDNTSKVLFNIINTHYQNYKTLATKEVIDVELNKVGSLNESQFKDCVELFESLTGNIDDTFNLDWAVDNTEKYCQDRGLHNAIMDSIKRLDEDSLLPKNGIPKLLEDALAIKFTSSIGHDYLEDSDDRYEQYHRQEEKIPFDIDLFNLATEGGFERKSLNVIMGSTGTGKTLVMCHMAAAAFLRGYNVLYLTMEMSRIKIAKRIDSNLINVPMGEINGLGKESYNKKLSRVASKTTGRLIVEEFPTSGANTLHFKSLIEELRIKKKFVPDIICIDYINICSSSRLKAHVASNPYVYIKAVAEEIRGLAVEYNACVISATQTNRAGFNNSDVDLDHTSDSWGLPHTVDWMGVLITNDDMASMQQMLVKELKTRYSDSSKYKKFMIGVDKSYMRIFNCEQSAQEDIDNGPVMDNTEFGKEDTARKFSGRKKKFGKGKTMEEFTSNV
ncbi:MAG: DNA primase [Candidatus Levybacteria bacterium]|nr:DNA primase [Candidatus Levybacteria bacterium]